MTARRPPVFLLSLPALLISGVALAAGLPPWIEPGDIPLAAGVRSVVAQEDEVPVYVGPSAATPRRGVLGRGIPLPLFAAKRGGGCAGRWISIGPLAWTCQDKVQLSREPAVSASELAYRDVPNGLPYDYHYVGRDGTSAYATLRGVDVSMPDEDLEPGFAVAVVEKRRRYGETYARTTRDLWVPARDLVPVREPTFRGEQVGEDGLTFAWVVDRTVQVLSKPSAYARTSQRVVRFQVIRVLEEKKRGGRTYYRVGDRTWLPAKGLRKPSLAPPPKDTVAGERWIDIELSSQTLVAYEGERPVYATLVSTGKGRQGTAFATPKGEHRIWVKLVASSMDNLEDDGANDYYSIEDVPFVQFFSRGVGLHATFWHNRFGFVRSHGCVNLTPPDAQWLFSWTSPRIPAGWMAVFPTDLDPGTVVRVR